MTLCRNEDAVNGKVDNDQTIEENQAYINQVAEPEYGEAEGYYRSDQDEKKTELNYER